jgi:ureidoacrylate peracid hydrolase
MEQTRYSQETIDFIMRRRARMHIYETLDPGSSALVVVDMQQAFVAEGAAIETPAARAIVPNINSLAAAMRETGGTVVWIISTYGPRPEDYWPTFFDHVMSPEAAERFRGALIEGCESHRLYDQLDVVDADPVVSKNRFGAFVGSGGRLEELLRAKGIDTLLIAGTVTNMCCETTAREAAMLSFKTIMVSDANAGRTQAEHDATLSAFLMGMGDVHTSDALIAMLEAGKYVGDAHLEQP